MKTLKALTKAGGFPLILASVIAINSGCGNGQAQVPRTAFSSMNSDVATTLHSDLSKPNAAVHQDVVQGCQLFPASDFWNLDIYAAPLDANSSAMMATAISGSNNSSMSGVFQSQYLNVVPYNEAAGTVHPKVSWHTFPIFTGAPSNGWPIGSGNPHFAIEGGDAYMHILQKAGGGHPCWLYSIYDASYNGSTLSGYGGAGFPLNVPVTPFPPGCNNGEGGCGGTGVGSTGMMERPFYARVDEIIAGQITHALDGEFPVSAICSTEHLYPAVSSAQGRLASKCLPGAAKIRLKASFDTSGFSGDGLVVANGLKHFGIAVMDNGCCFGVYYGKQQSWDSRNIDTGSINQVMGALHMSDFEVVKLGPTNGSAYTYPGSTP
jgi:hypothetical protein